MRSPEVLQSENNVLLPLSLFVVTILTRIPFGSKLLYHWDSVQFALAIENYDIRVHQPHPPGYFLYVVLGEILNFFIHNANTSFVIMSIVASGLVVSAIFVLANSMYGRKTALLSSALAITSPLFWFHGEVALTYILEAFLSVFFAYLCWKILKGEHRLIFLSAIVLALSGGIRQSTMVFLMPLWLYSIRRVPFKYILISFALLIAGVLSWLFPMLSLTGGYTQYMALVNEQWVSTIQPHTVFEEGFKSFLGHLEIIARTIIESLGVFAAFIIFYSLKTDFKEIKSRFNFSEKGLFIGLWIMPSIFFYILVMVCRGYCLIFMPALIIIAANIFTSAVRKEYFSSKVAIVLVLLAIIFNMYIFLNTCSLMSTCMIRMQQTRVTGFIKAVRENLAPAETIILSYDYALNGARHYMYYLPEYKAYIIDERGDYLRGRRRGVSWGINHKTLVSDAIYIPKKTKYFVSPIGGLGGVLHNMILSGEPIKILYNDGERTAFYGDISLAPKVYKTMKFVMEDK